jgi:hypothetical protein
MSYTTKQILGDTQSRPPNAIFFEQIIKTLAEPIIIKALREVNESLERDYYGWFMISRGADALNYYYPIDKYIPTHDWDIVMINVTTNKILNTDFVIMNEVRKTFLEYLKDKLNEFFKTSVLTFDDSNINPANQNIIQKRNSIIFTYTYNLDRLQTLKYEYTDVNGVNNHGAILDLYMNNIIDDISPTNNPEKYKTKFTKESIHQIYLDRIKILLEISKKNKTQLSISKIETDVVRYIQALSTKSGGTLYRNAIELIIKDEKSGMYYIAPGDLLTDTMNMIYLSTNNLVPKRNNKVAIYLAKYASLLDVINEFIELCPDDSCEEINKYIIKRNTDNFKCVSEEEIDILFKKFYILSDDYFERISNRKKCEMFTILSFIAK